MKNRSEWLTLVLFCLVVLGALGMLLRRGIHGQTAALAIALLVILFLRIGFFVWNLRKQREQVER
jgi:UDP-N-acetylmuramyl pentapeptide phosphotransferase/UDP-N-acetylglucosamine-1-phosphate transferase